MGSSLRENQQESERYVPRNDGQRFGVETRDLFLGVHVSQTLDSSSRVLATIGHLSAFGKSHLNLILQSLHRTAAQNAQGTFVLRNGTYCIEEGRWLDLCPKRSTTANMQYSLIFPTGNSLVDSWGIPRSVGAFTASQCHVDSQTYLLLVHLHFQKLARAKLFYLEIRRVRCEPIFEKRGVRGGDSDRFARRGGPESRPRDLTMLSVDEVSDLIFR